MWRLTTTRLEDPNRRQRIRCHSNLRLLGTARCTRPMRAEETKIASIYDQVAVDISSKLTAPIQE
jgi:hypothetical protein